MTLRAPPVRKGKKRGEGEWAAVGTLLGPFGVSWAARRYAGTTGRYGPVAGWPDRLDSLLFFSFPFLFILFLFLF
jgi:hypothetical protein